MSTFLIRYEGPSAHTVRTATLIADAEGVSLRGSRPPQRHRDVDAVVLAITVEGTADAVIDAVALIRGELPAGATIEIEGQDPPRR